MLGRLLFNKHLSFVIVTAGISVLRDQLCQMPPKLVLASKRAASFRYWLSRACRLSN